MLVCHKIKLGVSDQDAATLEFMQAKCRGLFARRGPHTPIAECGVLQDDGLDVAGMGPAQVA